MRKSEKKPRLILGTTRTPGEGRPMGFGAAKPTTTARRTIGHAGDGHLLTVAPTGAGKGRGSIIPNLLTYPGSVICIDPKGENYQVTHRQRRRLGQRVIRLDPFGVTGEPTDRLNPFDLLGLPRSTPDADVEMLVELVVGDATSHSDRFWDLTSGGLLTGLCGYLSEQPAPHLGGLFDLLHGDDVDYNIAVLLDNTKFRTPLFHQELASYLQNESDKCRPSIRSTAQARVKTLGSAPVRNVLGTSTFDLSALLRGEPLSIFLILPPEKMHSHRALNRLWVGTLLSAVMRRDSKPQLPTLFLLDEVAQLGSMPLLRQALTLLRGYGLQCWTFWQDLSQLRQLYPTDWQCIVNNSAVLQFFGMTNKMMAAECAALVGAKPEDLERLKPGEQLIHRAGRSTETARRLDYLRDGRFRGTFDANRRFTGGREM